MCSCVYMSYVYVCIWCVCAIYVCVYMACLCHVYLYNWYAYVMCICVHTVCLFHLCLCVWYAYVMCVCLYVLCLYHVFRVYMLCLCRVSVYIGVFIPYLCVCTWYVMCVCMVCIQIDEMDFLMMTNFTKPSRNFNIYSFHWLAVPGQGKHICKYIFILCASMFSYLFLFLWQSLLISFVTPWEWFVWNSL